MKIAITNPPWYFEDESGMIRYGIRAGSRWPFTITTPDGYKPFPFFMAYAHSYLLKNNFESYFIDAITAQQAYDKFFSAVDDIDPDFVVVETSTPSIQNDLSVATTLTIAGYKVILVGSHATVFADELIRQPFVYAVLKGEYEMSLLKFCNDPIGKVYKYENFDLNDLPWPYRDSNLIWKYTERTHNNIPKQISMMTSRGCPFRCTFCQWPPVIYNSKLRERSVENIENEIKYLISRFGNDIFIYLDDDTFNLKEDRTLAISRMISKYDIKWSAMCRIDTLSRDAWKEMFDCGCICVNIGIETGSPRLLEKINKRLDIGRAEQTINYLTTIGYYIHCTFTWGIPGETKDDVEFTKRLFARINVHSKQESRCIPMPGTSWWNNLSTKEKKSIDYDGFKTKKNLLDK